MPRLLCVEDDRRLAASIASDLADAGFDVTAVGSAEESLPLLLEAPPDLLLLDVRLPGMSGIELAKHLSMRGKLPPTIVISGHATISETLTGLRLGVLDFVEKPFGRERLLTSVRNALTRAALERDVRVLRKTVVEGELLGDSVPMQLLRQQISRAAAADARVLIKGPSGAGKELVASALHDQSARRDRPFVKLNCAAIPVTMIEDELFGHTRGAFTGAHTDKAGLFEEADTGVLFLDEIGDMELPLQARLLRVLEDGRVRRLGETRERAVDVRVVAATNQDLDALTRERQFREDLFFRLAHLVIEVPALRDRRTDIGPLVTHFLEYFSRLHRVRARHITADAVEMLERYAWPGNVRELRNLCERLVVFGNDPISAEQLPPQLAGGAALGGESLLRLDAIPDNLHLRPFRERCEREYIAWTLHRAGWNVSVAARILGLGRTALHDKLAAMGIHRPDPDHGSGG